MPDAAVILAGGAGRRLGGVDKPSLVVGGRSLLARALDAVGDARTVVVGPQRELPPGIDQVREHPPGAGPAAGLAAGLGQLRPEPQWSIVILAADLPAISPDTIDRLAAALGQGTGAVLVDDDGRRQYLVGVFRAGPLQDAVAGKDWTGRRLAGLLDPLITAEVPCAGDEAADVDTPDELEKWRDEG